MHIPDADIVGQYCVHLAAVCITYYVLELFPVISSIDDKTLLGIYFQLAVLTGVETVVDSNQALLLIACKRLTFSGVRSDFCRCKKTVVEYGLAACVNKTYHSCIVVTLATQQATIETAVLKINITLGHESHNTSIGGVTCNGAGYDNRRLAVFNEVIATVNLSYQTTGEFLFIRVDRTVYSQIADGGSLNIAEWSGIILSIGVIYGEGIAITIVGSAKQMIFRTYHNLAFNQIDIAHLEDIKLIISFTYQLGYALPILAATNQEDGLSIIKFLVFQLLEILVVAHDEAPLAVRLNRSQIETNFHKVSIIIPYF